MDESQNIEYKKIWKDEYLKWICGFANANGGHIFLGMDDDPPHDVVGLYDADKLMEDLPNKVRDVLGIMVDVNLHHEGEQKKCYIEDIVQFDFNVPPTIEEQNAICDILEDIDNEIKALSTKLNKYKMLKQGIIQGLLVE